MATPADKYTIDVSTLTPGPHTITASATDMQNLTITGTITIKIMLAPVVTISCSHQICRSLTRVTALTFTGYRK